MLQNSTALRSTNDRITQIRVKTFKDAGLQQKLLHHFGLSVKDFIPQIIQYIAMIPCERRDKFSRVIFSPATPALPTANRQSNLRHGYLVPLPVL